MQQKSFDLPRDAKYARASLFPLKKNPVTLSALIWKTTPRFDFTFDICRIFRSILFEIAAVYGL